MSNNSNSTGQHWSDNFDTSFRFLTVSIEIIEWPIILFGVLGMFFSLEISHPVFSVLFCNLSASFICSSLNIITLLATSFRFYTKTAIMFNFVCYVFHCCCWCVISILRFMLLVKKDWTNRRFPDLR